jgi:hypothetical protein
MTEVELTDSYEIQCANQQAAMNCKLHKQIYQYKIIIKKNCAHRVSQSVYRKTTDIRF